MEVILYLLGIIGVFCFLKNKQVAFLVIATTIVFNCYSIFGPEITSRTNVDVAIYMCLIIIALQSFSINDTYPIGDRIGRLLLILLGYYGIRSIVTVIMDEETAVYSLKVFRMDLIFVLYFVLRQIDNETIKRFIIVLLRIVLVVGLVYLFQFVYWLINKEVVLYNAIMIRSIVPPLFLLVLFEKIDIKGKYYYLAFMAVLLMATFARGIILSTAGAIVVYYIYIKRNITSIVPLVLFILTFGYLFSFVDESKAEDISDLSTTEEIKQAISLKSYNDFESGSFALRYTMAWERIDYLSKDFGRLLFGVGAIHEDSPNNRFNFYVGSYKTLNGVRSKQMIDTDDVAFLAHFFRYGIVYLIIFIYILFSVFRIAKSNIDHEFSCVLFLVFITICISSFSVDFFSNIQRMFFPILLMSRLSTINYEENYEIRDFNFS